MAKLPKIQHPIFDIVIPSSKKKTKIRPMLVKEEKILLMAKVSENPYDIYEAIKQICNNCLVSGDINVSDLTIFDMEYIFLRIRAVSVSNIIRVSYMDEDDQKEYPFEIDLDKVSVRFPEKSNLKISTGPDEGFLMKYPTVEIYSSPEFTKPDSNPTERIDALVISCIDQYFSGENIYRFADNSAADVREFIDSLDVNTYAKIREWVSDLPTLYHEIKYTNGKGQEKTIRLMTLTDFFTLV